MRSARAAHLFGREAELARAETFIDAASSGPAGLVLEGEAGIGKTTLWEAAIEAAGDRSARVLIARPNAAETQLSFAALTDLLSAVDTDSFDAVPAPQRRALDVALLREDPEGPLPDHRTLATGFLSVLASLAGESPVILAVDDVQWIDPPTARVLEFALRRLRSERVGALVCARLPEQRSVPLGLDRSIESERLTRIRLGPLTVIALDRMIEDRLGIRFPRRILTRIAATSAGNPFFALEIARSLGDTEPQPLPGEDLPIPSSLMNLVEQRIANLPDETRDVLTLISAAANPTMKLLNAVAQPSTDAVLAAEAAGIVRVEGEQVRFSHPLLAAAVWSATPASARERLHRRLADHVTDPEERARHLAAVATVADEQVASTVAAAARSARTRGAPDAAATLYERSATLTPEARTEERSRRVIDAAECHVDAGDDDRARLLLERAVDELPAGALRAEALLHLGNVRYRLLDAFSAIRLLEQALGESAGDAALRSAIERRLAYMLAATGNMLSGLDHARAAVELLEGSGDDAALSEALAHVTITEFLLGQGIASERMDRALALEKGTAYRLPLESRPSLIHALLLLWTDRAEEARSVIERLADRLREEGDESSLPYTDWVLGLVELAVGNVERASYHVEHGLAAAEIAGHASLEGMLLAVATEVYTWSGEVERARKSGEEGVARTMQMGLASGMVFNTTALGFLELSVGDPAAAHRVLGPLADLHLAIGIGDPGVLRFLPDEVEALITIGEIDRAAALLEPFEAKAGELLRQWAIATAARCRGLLAAVQGDGDDAMTAFEAALQAHRRHTNPLELGRTLVVKGRVHRRRKEKRAARESLLEALKIFEDKGARLWADMARAEIARLGGRRPAASELTATEQRVAELAATGMTIRQVAEATFLTPKSVEGVLGRVYRKLGIRSRAELGATMAERGSHSASDDPPI